MEGARPLSIFRGPDSCCSGSLTGALGGWAAFRGRRTGHKTFRGVRWSAGPGLWAQEGLSVEETHFSGKRRPGRPSLGRAAGTSWGEPCLFMHSPVGTLRQGSQR